MTDRFKERELVDQQRVEPRGLRRSRTLITWNGGVNAMVFDAVVDVNYHRVAQVSSFPVEDGAVYSDHIQTNPLELNIEAYVSDQPAWIPDTQVAEGVVGAYQESTTYKQWLEGYERRELTFSLPSGRLVRNTIDLARPTNVTVPKVIIFQGGSPKRVANVFEQLDTLIDQGVLLQVKTRFSDFDNMVLRTVDAISDNRTGDGARFRLDLVQIKIVQTAKVFGGARRVPTRPKDDEGDDKGGDAEDQSNKEGSVLASLRDGRAEWLFNQIDKARQSLGFEPSASTE